MLFFPWAIARLIVQGFLHRLMGQVIALRDCQLFELHAEDLAYLSHVGHRQRSVRQQVLEVGRQLLDAAIAGQYRRMAPPRSEEHTSELQSLMRISYAVFCLKKKNT